MIRVLYAVNVGIVVLACVVIGRIEWFATRNGEQIEGFLRLPSAADRVRQDRATRDQSRDDPIPPLVSSAQHLTDLLTPVTNDSDFVPPPPPRPTFAVLGTSCTCDASQSFAYVWTPGREYEWVRSGDTIDHVVVQEIGNGSITCSDGKRRMEIPVEPVAQTAALVTSKAGTRPRR